MVYGSMNCGDERRDGVGVFDENDSCQKGGCLKVGR